MNLADSARSQYAFGARAPHSTRAVDDDRVPAIGKRGSAAPHAVERDVLGTSDVAAGELGFGANVDELRALGNECASALAGDLSEPGEREPKGDDHAKRDPCGADVERHIGLRIVRARSGPKDSGVGIAQKPKGFEELQPFEASRGERIRTSDPLTPSQVR
jgi:hypothetical protein